MKQKRLARPQRWEELTRATAAAQRAVVALWRAQASLCPVGDDPARRRAQAALLAAWADALALRDGLESLLARIETGA